jgi:pyruvate,orthophosphate dikinase
LLSWADIVARTKIHVYANADTAADADLARDLGAAGVGLCRTEHQFLGERVPLMERILAGDPAAIAEMAELQRADVHAVLERVAEGPVIIRLLDAPRHEFDSSHHEHNPMLGLRGIRMAVQHPEILMAQAEAIAHATADRSEDLGVFPDVGVMLPMVSTVEELKWARTLLNDVFFRVGIERGVELHISVGTMIETPRAALIAASLASHCDFFSFGTNDLTQLTWGYSRDDLDAELVPLYRAQGLLDRSPFETLDGSGVVRLMALAAETGRAQNPDLGLGMCGEHGGDPASIAVAVQLGLTSVSVSPYRVPAARLAAAHAVLGPVPKSGGR